MGITQTHKCGPVPSSKEYYLSLESEKKKRKKCSSNLQLAFCYNKPIISSTQDQVLALGPNPSLRQGGQLSAMATSQAQLICFRTLTTNTQTPKPVGLCLPPPMADGGEQEGAEVIEMLF